ncbi:PTS system protein [Klebsiella michiganensis]|uniref:PTS system protein n=1 Tax=Klebsiella michiganensis TaxID=1134687 RepID=A0A7H4PF80_9ENTR|nr:PTS system protein [Klebsiella michiganensis]
MSENKIPVSQEIKKHLLTGISWMIPLIVAAGICIALGQVLGGTNVGEKTGTIPWMLNPNRRLGNGADCALDLRRYRLLHCRSSWILLRV